MNLNAKSWETLLYAVVDGEINPKSAERLLKLTSSMAARKGISRVLVDARRVTGTLLNSERVELAAKLADHVNKLGARPSVAFVGHPPAFNGFGVVAGRSRGVNVMLFDSMPDALAWLRRQHSREKRPVAA